ncbi:MAG: cytochrome c-type biogenesis protein [Chromatiales bacterium]
MTRVAVLLLLLLMMPSMGSTRDAVPTSEDPLAAARAVRIEKKLRCLVCQNQSIAESNADLAVDLRREIHTQIAAGRSDGEIIAFMVQRYGDFILYRPPFKPATVLLWLGPALLFALGVWVLRRALRAQSRATATSPLSAEEHALAERLLADETNREGKW